MGMYTNAAAVANEQDRMGKAHSKVNAMQNYSTHMAIAPNVDTIAPAYRSHQIMYNVQDTIAFITPDFPVLAPSSRPSTPKVLQGANTRKWP